MNYISLINHFWKLNSEKQFTSGETQLFFKLCDTDNKLGWKPAFYQTNKYLTGETGLGQQALAKCRRKLKERGLINYELGKTKNCPIIYIIIQVNNPGNDRGPGSDPQPVGIYKTRLIVQKGDDGNHNSNTPDTTTLDPAENPLKTPATAACENSQAQEVTTPAPASRMKTVDNTQENNASGDEKSADNNKQDVNSNKTKDNFLFPEGAGAPSEQKKCKTPVEKIFFEYNSICTNLPRAVSLSKSRIEIIQRQINNYGSAEILRMFEIANRSNFLAGNNNLHWKANLEWLLNPKHMDKIFDGVYDNKNAPTLEATRSKPLPRHLPSKSLR